MRIETENATLLLDLSEGALHNLALRAGIAAAEESLRLYRERHRSSMMMAASQAFADISGGACAALARAAETLVAIPSGGGVSKLAADLSKGTGF